MGNSLENITRRSNDLSSVVTEELRCLQMVALGRCRKPSAATNTLDGGGRAVPPETDAADFSSPGTGSLGRPESSSCVDGAAPAGARGRGKPKWDSNVTLSATDDPARTSSRRWVVRKPQYRGGWRETVWEAGCGGGACVKEGGYQCKLAGEGDLINLHRHKAPFSSHPPQRLPLQGLRAALLSHLMHCSHSRGQSEQRGGHCEIGTQANWSAPARASQPR
jgi:hypothetical protein